MDYVAGRLVAGDAVERALWSDVLVRAVEICDERDHARLAVLLGG